MMTSCLKPGIVRDFNTCHENVRELTKTKGNDGNKSCPRKLFISNFTFGPHRCLVGCCGLPCIACFKDSAAHEVIVNISVELCNELVELIVMYA